MDIENDQDYQAADDANVQLPVLASPNINSLPDLPFETFFSWIPLGDLLSAQFVCQQWQESAFREASTHRDSITLCIDGQAENQKAALYLERSVWNLPHAEKLRNDHGAPLFPDYVPPSKRSSWSTLLLGTRLDNPIQMDGTLLGEQKHRQWQAHFDLHFRHTLDRKVSQLLTLFPRGPHTLTIVCRSEHRDFLQLLPLLTKWKDQLVTLSLYISHPQALDSPNPDSYISSSMISHSSNGALLAVLNSMPLLRHLTLDLLCQDSGTHPWHQNLPRALSLIRLARSDECTPIPDLSFLSHLESLIIADGNVNEFMFYWLSNVCKWPEVPFGLPFLKSLKIGNPTYLIRPLENYGHLLQPYLHHLTVQLERGRPLEVRSEAYPSFLASLTSLFLNFEVGNVSLLALLQYLSPLLQLLYLRLHLTGEQVARWYREMASLQNDHLPPLPCLRVLSLILVNNQPIDNRLPSLLQRLFPSLQVIVITQQIISFWPFGQLLPSLLGRIASSLQGILPANYKKTSSLQTETCPYLASIRRHFTETFLTHSSLLFVEARLNHYQNWNRLHLLQSNEKTWTVEELETSFI